MLDYGCLKQLIKYLNVDVTSHKDVNLSFYSSDYKTKNCDLLNEFMIKGTKEKVLVIDATSYVYLWSDNLKTFKNIFYNVLKKIQIYCSQKCLRGIVFLMDQRIMKVKHYDDYEFNNNVNKTPNVSNFNNDNSISEDENNYARFNYCNDQYKELLGCEEINDYHKERLKDLGREFDELMSTKLPLKYIDQLKNKDFKFFVMDTIIELLYKNINFTDYCKDIDNKFLILSSYSKYYFIDKSSYDKTIKRSKENEEIEKMLKLQYYEADQIIPYICDLLKQKFDIFVCGNDGDLLLGLLDNCSKRIKTKKSEDKKFVDMDNITFENEIIILKDIWKNINKITKSIGYYDINDLYIKLTKSIQIIGNNNNNKFLKYNIDPIFYITTICRLCKNDYIDKKNIPELGPAILFKTFFDQKSFLQFQDKFFKIIKINNKFIISIDYSKFVSYIIHCYLNSSRVIVDSNLSNNFNIKDTIEDIFQKTNNNYQDKLLERCKKKKDTLLNRRKEDRDKKLNTIEKTNNTIEEIKKSYKDDIKEIKKTYRHSVEEIPKNDYININNINNVFTTLIFSINYFSQFYDDITKIDDGCKVSDDTNKSIYGYSLINNYKNEYGLYKVNLCKNIDVNLYC